MHSLGLGIQNPLDLLGRIGKLAEQHARLLSGQAVLDLRQQQGPKSVRLTTWPMKLLVEATAISLLAFV